MASEKTEDLISGEARRPNEWNVFQAAHPGLKKQDCRDLYKKEKVNNPSQPERRKARKTRIRCSLNKFRIVLSDLTDRQKEVVAKTPFSSLLDFEKGGLSLKRDIIKSIVSHFNCDKMTLTICKGGETQDFPITDEDFSNIMGIRNGKGASLVAENVELDHNLLDKFCILEKNERYKYIDINKVKNELKNAVDDNAIKQTFALIALYYIVCPARASKLGKKFLWYVKDANSPHDQPWVTVAMSALKHGIQTYNKAKGTEKNLGGCVLFLQLYCMKRRGFMEGVNVSEISKEVVEKFHNNWMIDHKIKQATPIIGKQSPVATSMEEKTQSNTDGNDETSPSDEIVNGDSSINKKQPTDGQFEDLDSDMTDKEKREKNTEMKASTIGYKRKNGGLNKELKSLQASTKGSEVDLFRTRTQEIEAKKDATKNLTRDEKTSCVTKSSTKQADVPSASLTVVDQGGSEGDAVSVALKRKTKINLSRKGKRRKQRTISVNTELPAQVSVVSEEVSKEKADESLEKGSTTNPEASIGKSPDTMPDDQPIFEENQSPVTISNQQLNLSVEKTVEESTSRAGAKVLDLGSLPFIRNMALWKTLESMEAFRKLPQKPHFRPLLEGVKEGAREGLAIGAMVTFATAVDQTCSLKFDDSKSIIKDCLETLVELEENGFEVEVLRKRLTEFLSIKDQYEKLVEESKGFDKEFEELNVQDKEIVEEIAEMNRQMRELEEIKTLALVKKEERDLEIGAMEGVIEGIKQEIKEVDAEFDKLTKAPFV